MFVIGAMLVIWLVTLPCVAAAKLCVVCAAVFLVFARFGFLPQVSTDKDGFGIFFAAVLFFVPAFSALMPGFRRSQATRKRSIDEAAG
jgi:hypothetical protein